MANAYVDAVTKTVDVNGTSFAYRETGEKNGIPIVLLHHLTAVLDDWDPRTIDSLDQKHRIIAFNNRGGERKHEIRDQKSTSKVQPTVVVNAFPTMAENSKEDSWRQQSQ